MDAKSAIDKEGHLNLQQSVRVSTWKLGTHIWLELWFLSFLSYWTVWLIYTWMVSPSYPPQMEVIKCQSKMAFVFTLDKPGINIWLWHQSKSSHAKNGVNLDFKFELTLTVNANKTLKTIGIRTKLFCIFCPNLVVVAWAGDALSYGQARG